MILHLMGPVFLHMQAKITAAPVEDFWEGLGKKSPPPSDKPVPLAAVEEAAFVVSAELKQ